MASSPCNPTPLEPGSIIKYGNWGRIIRNSATRIIWPPERPFLNTFALKRLPTSRAA
jgi:hypothetical protein